MSELEIILATTHVDLHNERMAVSALEGMVEQANTKYIPMGVEHDPRFPPMGRILKAEIVGLGDGEHAVKATVELFDVGEVVSDTRRTMPLDVEDVERFRVLYDRTLAARDEAGDVYALAQLAGAPAHERGKKALEPLAELVLQFGQFAVGGIALGVFAKIGEDVWNQIKSRLVNRYESPKNRELFVNSFWRPREGPPN